MDSTFPSCHKYVPLVFGQCCEIQDGKAVETSAIPIVNNESAHRFEARVDGLVAFLLYRRFPDRLVLVHTEVPAELQHRGIATRLVATALTLARDSHLRVIPLCPFVLEFIRNHPEYQDVVSAKDLPEILSGQSQPEELDVQRAHELRELAFYEIARQANLTDDPELAKSPAFQRAQQLFKARAEYFSEAFGNQTTIDDYLKLRLEGYLARQGKTWRDVWQEFAPESLKSFPLPTNALP